MREFEAALARVPRTAIHRNAERYRLEPDAVANPWVRHLVRQHVVLALAPEARVDRHARRVARDARRVESARRSAEPYAEVSADEQVGVGLAANFDEQGNLSRVEVRHFAAVASGGAAHGHGVARPQGHLEPDPGPRRATWGGGRSFLCRSAGRDAEAGRDEEKEERGFHASERRRSVG